MEWGRWDEMRIVKCKFIWNVDSESTVGLRARIVKNVDVGFFHRIVKNVDSASIQAQKNWPHLNPPWESQTSLCWQSLSSHSAYSPCLFHPLYGPLEHLENPPLSHLLTARQGIGGIQMPLQHHIWWHGCIFQMPWRKHFLWFQYFLPSVHDSDHFCCWWRHQLTFPAGLFQKVSSNTRLGDQHLQSVHCFVAELGLSSLSPVGLLRHGKTFYRHTEWSQESRWTGDCCASLLLVFRGESPDDCFHVSSH